MTPSATFLLSSCEDQSLIPESVYTVRCGDSVLQSLELAEPGVHKTLFSRTNIKLVRKVSCSGVELITVGEREWGGGEEGGEVREGEGRGEGGRACKVSAAVARVVSSGA